MTKSDSRALVPPPHALYNGGMEALGIDIGGSGIKGAPVNLQNGTLITERHRIPTPHPSTPGAVGATVAEIVDHFNWKGKVGICMPSPILNRVARLAANIDDSWIGEDVFAVFNESTGRECTVVNDGDAAGLAEMRYGAGRKQSGTVFLITVGTGLGTALFTDGTLVPNTELGHLYFADGMECEWYAADAARKREALAWPGWTRRFDRYLKELERLFYPELFIIGGGTSRKAKKFLPYLTVTTPVVMAELRNNAGIIGAASATAGKL